MTDLPPYSAAAEERWRTLEAKAARGEQITWTDMRGIAEPNPDLPDCQAWEGDYQCQLPNHHGGRHRHVIEWGRPAAETEEG